LPGLFIFFYNNIFFEQIQAFELTSYKEKDFSSVVVYHLCDYLKQEHLFDIFKKSLDVTFFESMENYLKSNDRLFLPKEQQIMLLAHIFRLITGSELFDLYCENTPKIASTIYIMPKPIRADYFLLILNSYCNYLCGVNPKYLFFFKIFKSIAVINF